MSGGPGQLWEVGKLASMLGKQTVSAMERGHSGAKGLSEQNNNVWTSISQVCCPVEAGGQMGRWTEAEKRGALP